MGGLYRFVYLYQLRVAEGVSPFASANGSVERTLVSGDGFWLLIVLSELWGVVVGVGMVSDGSGFGATVGWSSILI
jgi:hypothetical protein